MNVLLSPQPSSNLGGNLYDPLFATTSQMIGREGGICMSNRDPFVLNRKRALHSLEQSSCFAPNECGQSNKRFASADAVTANLTELRLSDQDAQSSRDSNIFSSSRLPRKVPQSLKLVDLSTGESLPYAPVVKSPLKRPANSDEVESMVITESPVGVPVHRSKSRRTNAHVTSSYIEPLSPVEERCELESLDNSQALVRVHPYFGRLSPESFSRFLLSQGVKHADPSAIQALLLNLSKKSRPARIRGLLTAPTPEAQDGAIIEQVAEPLLSTPVPFNSPTLSSSQITPPLGNDSAIAQVVSNTSVDAMDVD